METPTTGNPGPGSQPGPEPTPGSELEPQRFVLGRRGRRALQAVLVLALVGSILWIWFGWPLPMRLWIALVPLPELTFHGLRHCAGSLWLASGVDISIVSKLLGHSSISVTADIYAHMLKAVGQQAVDGAANLIAHTVHTQQAVSG